MNIFVLDQDPILAATMMCNKHIPKMIVESAQLLATAHANGSSPYKHTHFNHSCAKWVRQSIDNYCWLVVHAKELCNQYTQRYGKIHATQKVVQWYETNIPELPLLPQTPFAIAIKDTTYHTNDPITSYRAYYIGDKSKFARWAPRATAPSWWPFAEGEVI